MEWRFGFAIGVCSLAAKVRCLGRLLEEEALGESAVYFSYLPISSCEPKNNLPAPKASLEDYRSEYTAMDAQKTCKVTEKVPELLSLP